MRRDEDDRYAASFRLELGLQFKAGHAWHANVRDQACSLVLSAGIQELFRGPEAERRKPFRFDQVLQGGLKRPIIVDYRDES